MFGRAYRLPVRLAGIPIEISPSFLLILPLIVWMIAERVRSQALQSGFDSTLARGAGPYVVGFVCAVGLFVGVLLHELGHAIVARSYNVKVRSIMLWFLGGLAQFDQMPTERGAEAAVAIVGPLVSIALAAVCFLAQTWIPLHDAAVRFTLEYLCVMNLVLGIFNLLPALPLDGGRIVRSLLALKVGRVLATNYTTRVSIVLAMLLGFVGIITFQVFFVLVAFFIFRAATLEAQAVLVEEALGCYRVRDLMTTNVVSISPEMTMAELRQEIVRERHSAFPVISNRGVVGVVSLDHIRGAAADAPVSQVMSAVIPTVHADDSALDAMAILSDPEKGTFGRVIATDYLGRMVGILSRSDLERLVSAQPVQYAPAPAQRPEPSLRPGVRTTKTVAGAWRNPENDHDAVFRPVRGHGHTEPSRW